MFLCTDVPRLTMGSCPIKPIVSWKCECKVLAAQHRLAARGAAERRGFPVLTAGLTASCSPLPPTWPQRITRPSEVLEKIKIPHLKSSFHWIRISVPEKAWVNHSKSGTILVELHELETSLFVLWRCLPFFGFSEVWFLIPLTEDRENGFSSNFQQQ